MSIKLSLLALLSEQSRYGYELKSEFDQRTGNSWPVNIGQVYTTLDRLERDNLVTRGTSDAEGRVVYSIADAGRREVASWFSEPVEQTAPPRNELAIKIAIAVTIDGIDVAQIVQNQRRASIARLQSYTALRRRVASSDLAWWLIIESLIFDTEAEVRWLDHCEASIMRASHSRTNAASDEHSRTNAAFTHPSRQSATSERLDHIRSHA